MRYEIDFKKAGCLAAFALGAFLSIPCPEKPKVYTGIVEGKKARVEKYADRTIVEVEDKNGFCISGTDLDSDGSFNRIKFAEPNGPRSDLGDYLAGKYGNDTATIKSVTESASIVLEYARRKLSGDN